jgi:hypothetical protein
VGCRRLRQLLLSLDEREALGQEGLPDQLGGTPWCLFCRSSRPRLELRRAAGRGAHGSLVAPHRRPAILLYDDVSLTGIDITGDQRFPRLLDGVADHCGPQSDQGGAHPLLSC